MTSRVAKERGTTYILLGESSKSGIRQRLAEPLPQKLMHRLPGVDVRIVADRSKRAEEGGDWS